MRDLDSRLVQLRGQRELVERLGHPLGRALGERRASYVVQIETVGMVGEVLVSVTGAKGRLPILFGREDLEPGYVARVVTDTVARFNL
jgi:hypothetical protein